MDKFVACLYIQDYRETIAAEADEAQRHKLLRLLAEDGSDRGARKERAARLGRNFPLPPICRSPINQLLGSRVNPPLEDTAAWKDKGVRPSWLNGASSGHGRTVQSI